MSDYITKVLTGEATIAEERALRSWRAASETNEARFQRRSELWALLGRVPEGGGRPIPDAAALIANIGVQPLARRHARGGRDSRRLWRTLPFASVGALAAIVALILVVWPAPSPPEVFGPVEFIVGPQETNTVRLADGTVVLMAPGSRIRFSEAPADQREIEFEGLGYFSVARDPERPFVVRTPAGDATVLGTRFELRARDEAVRVVVVEGSVALSAEGQEKRIAANQMGHAAANEPPSVVDIPDVTEFVGWIDGLHAFQSTPLHQVARELSAHYGAQIEIRSEELAQQEVTAWLRAQSFDAALTAVCGAVGAVCTIRPDRAVLDLPGRDGN